MRTRSGQASRPAAGEFVCVSGQKETVVRAAKFARRCFDRYGPDGADSGPVAVIAACALVPGSRTGHLTTLVKCPSISR